MARNNTANIATAVFKVAFFDFLLMVDVNIMASLLLPGTKKALRMILESPLTRANALIYY